MPINENDNSILEEFATGTQDNFSEEDQQHFAFQEGNTSFETPNPLYESFEEEEKADVNSPLKHNKSGGKTRSIYNPLAAQNSSSLINNDGS